jgi:hypothetical protein
VVVVLSMVAQGSFSSGNEGSQAGGEGFGSWRLRWRKRERREVWLAAEMRGEAGFFVNFGPNSPHLWIMKIKFLYRRWKRDTLSLLMPNPGPWLDLKASQPLVQSSNDKLSVLYREMTGRVTTLG